MTEKVRERRPRRWFSPQFKTEVVELVRTHASLASRLQSGGASLPCKDPDISYLEARRHGHSRVENALPRIRGCTTFPSRTPLPNAAWVEEMPTAQASPMGGDSVTKLTEDSLDHFHNPAAAASGEGHAVPQAWAQAVSTTEAPFDNFIYFKMLFMTIFTDLCV